ncbi:mortality factor 4-like protein 2 [Phascolarctos cinereus]
MQPPAKRSRERVRIQGRRPRGSRGDAGDTKQESTGRFEVQVNLPKSLRPLFVQDWELVTLEKKLCNLPAKITVDAILSEYATFPLNCRTRDKRYAVCGLVAMVKEYFNVILSTQLLYDFERPQYAELVVSYPSCQMSQLYGGAHLLRLFQKLGPMFTCTPLDDSSLTVLLSHLQDFLEYLASSPSLLFIDADDYELASEEYLEVAI